MGVGMHSVQKLTQFASTKKIREVLPFYSLAGDVMPKQSQTISQGVSFFYHTKQSVGERGCCYQKKGKIPNCVNVLIRCSACIVLESTLIKLMKTNPHSSPKCKYKINIIKIIHHQLHSVLFLTVHSA